MIMKKERAEIMAPAGSFESLRAAIQAGADSVYFGVGKLNMRARAANFTEEDLEQVVSICSEAGVRTYLTVNTIVYDDELENIRELCLRAKSAGISAVIAMDMAVIEYARSIDMEVHLSTQVNVTNVQAVEYYSQFADVIVLARELNLQQIRSICNYIEARDVRGPSGNLLKIEVFVHGALCIAISGKCYMSLAQFNHSANRGDCFQTCRRTYDVRDTVTGQEINIDNQFVMSPADLCTLGMLERLVEAGASVFKIEGRGRSAEYVKEVVETYRSALNDIQKQNYTQAKKEEYIKRVDSVFNRGFWHDGYYLGHKTGEWASAKGSKATEKKVFLGVATNYYARPGIGEFQLQTKAFEIGDTLLVTGPTTGVLKFKVESIHGDNGPQQKAGKGEIIGVPVPEKIRPNDKLFVVQSNI
jgi:putative protease